MFGNDNTLDSLDSNLEQGLLYRTTNNTENLSSNAVIHRAQPRCSLQRVWGSTFCQNSRSLFKRALPLACSFSFTWQIFLVGVLGTWLDDDPQHTAAISWSQTFMAVCLALVLTPLMGINYEANYQLGRLKKALPDTNMKSLSTRDLHKNQYLAQIINQDPDYQNCYPHLSGYFSKIRSLFHAGLGLSPMLMTIGGLCLYFSKTILHNGFNQDAHVSQLAQNYLRPYSLALVGLALRTCFEQLLYAYEYYRQVMYVNLTGLALGTGLSSYLIKGSPDMGLQGIALGYAAESIATAIFLGTYLLRHADFEPYNFLGVVNWYESCHYALPKIFKYGMSMLFSDIFELGMTFGLVASASSISHEAQASWQAVMQLPFFAFPFILAWSITHAQTIENLRSQNAHPSQLKNWLRDSTLILAGLSLATAGMAIMSIGYYPNILGQYSESVTSELPTLTMIIAGGFVMDALRCQMLQTCKGMDANTAATVTSSIGLLIGGSFAGACSDGQTLGVDGVGLGYAGGMLISAFSLVRLWRRLIEEYSHQYANNNSSNNNRSQIQMVPTANPNRQTPRLSNAECSLNRVCSDPDIDEAESNHIRTNNSVASNQHNEPELMRAINTQLAPSL